MSRENVEIVVGMIESVNRRDWTAVENAHGDDVLLVLHGEYRSLAPGGEAVGKQAVVRWFGDWFRTFDRDYHFQIAEARDCGDKVLLVATHEARGRGSGVPVSYQGAWVYTLGEGKIARCDAFPTEAEALEAIGS